MFLTPFKNNLILLVIFGLLSLACSEKNSSTLSSTIETESLAINNASLPNLSKDLHGDVWLSFVSQNADESSLWLSKWQQGTWSKKELVAQGNNWFVNWADFPSVVSNDSQLFAHWLEMNGEGTYAYGVRYSRRAVKGDWSKPKWMHTDNSATEHGFVSLQADKDGAHALWLDGRNMQGAGHASHSNSNITKSLDDIQGMTLRYAFIDNNGVVKKRVELDSLTCDCCQTTMIKAQDQLVIAYRDRVVTSPDTEIRDMNVMYKKDGQWRQSKNIPIDNWDIQACPVNGPVLTENANNVALVWFTAANAKPKIQVVFSDDNAESFKQAIVVDANMNLGRVATDWINAETVFISWIGMVESKTVLLYRLVSIDGIMSEIQIASQIDMSRSSGVPQVAQIEENKILLSWTEAGEQPTIQSKVITIN